MAQSGVSVTPDCITSFNDLKLGKSTKWIIYKIADDWKTIVVEETSKEADYESFREKLLSAKSKGKDGKESIGPRYAVYDFEYDAPGGEGKSPDNASLMPKMMYSSSKDALKRSLNGLAADIQANDEDDIEYETIIGRVSKGR
ncbi:MAG: cofilin [Alyxoria varia]|nr:MAG: cofilin [Alyxoria varia]